MIVGDMGNNNYAFIDSQNLNLGVQKVGWKMDWRKFREWLREQYGVSKAYMFIGHMPEYEPLYDQMHDAGYLVVLKPTMDTNKMLHPDQDPSAKEKTDEKKPAVKGNTDADMVLWTMREYPNYDKAIIVTGDGDFFSLIEYLDQQGRLGHVMTPNWQYSSLLKMFDKYVIRLDQHRRELAYRDRPKKPSGRGKAGPKKSK
jgi:uncharacterized LabA/DUF88 family protein